MKKNFVYILALLLLLVTLTACGGKTTTVQETTSKIEQTTESQTTEVESVTEESSDDPVTAGHPIVNSFTAITEAKTDMLEKLQDALSEDDANFGMTMALLEPTMLDLHFIILPFLESEEAALMLGNKGCTINESGDHFTIDIINSQDSKLESNGMYDKNQDSLSYYVSIDGIPIATIEYVKISDKTYAMQYYAFENKHTIRYMFDDNNISIGIMNQEQPPESLYKNPPKNAFDYPRNDDFYILYKDGKIEEAYSTLE